jgi:hypothetical protein
MAVQQIYRFGQKPRHSEKTVSPAEIVGVSHGDEVIETTSSFESKSTMDIRQGSYRNKDWSLIVYSPLALNYVPRCGAGSHRG